MIYIILNALLYVVTLLLYWRLNRKLDLGFFILSGFTLVAILGIPSYGFLNFLYDRQITLLPYLYLYVVLLLFIRPYLFKVRTDLTEKIRVRSRRKLEVLAYLLIISFFFSVYSLLPLAIDNIKSGNWNQIRNELYQGDRPLLYGNFIEFLMIIYNQYFHLLGVLIFFYFLKLQRYKSGFLILLVLSCTIPLILLSICTASRGMLLYLVMEFVAGFILFKDDLTIGARKRFFTFVGILLSLILVYSLTVTVSRFGTGSSTTENHLASNLSLLDYFGQSMLTFNDGVADMNHYANGKYFFKYLLDSLKINSTINQNELGGHWGTKFFTFVGAFYIDIGPVGTFFLALIIPYFIRKNIKGTIYFENLYLYYFFFIFFLEGVFVTGYGSIFTWFFAFLIYLILKLE